MSSETKLSIKTLSIALIGGVLLLVAAYAALLLFFTWPVEELSINKSGVFGDSFGLLTALFSGLAFAGLIITIQMQKNELELQREELELTRKEFTGQKDELRIQNKTLKLQKFENTFFQMMTFHSEILKGIDLNRNKEVFTGRDAFRLIYDYIRTTSPIVKKISSADLDNVNEGYKSIYHRYQNELGHYFRYLYNILKFIDRSDLEDKRFYSNLLRAQLSNYELVLLFYNCLSEYGREKFKPLLEEYSLLKNLPETLIFNFTEQENLYESEAYAGS